MRRAFLPAVVSTSGRIHWEFLRLLYLLADNKTKLHFRALDEAIDVDSEANKTTLNPLLLAAERGFLAHAGFPRPSVRSGHHPVLSGFRQSQPAVPRRCSRAPTCLSPFT